VIKFSAVSLISRSRISFLTAAAVSHMINPEIIGSLFQVKTMPDDLRRKRRVGLELNFGPAEVLSGNTEHQPAAEVGIVKRVTQT
jgi:hypothetical protein